jgi:fatty-acyl-CoA synthase
MGATLASNAALSLGTWIDSLAVIHGERPALFADDAAVSYRELALRSRRLATGLSKIGVRKGDRVAVWLPNVSAWVEMLLACGRLGAIVVALNTRFRSGEVSDILYRSKARVLVYWPEFRGIPFADILADIPSDDLEFLETIVVYAQDGSASSSRVRGKTTVAFRDLGVSEPYHGPDQDADAGCLIITTSGTTSRPKFVLHSQRGLVSHSRNVAAIPGFYGEPGSVGFALMPLCGAFGLNQTLAALAGGAPTVLQTAFEPSGAAAAIRRYGVTTMAGVDEVFYKMLDVFPEPHPFPSLRYVVFGSFNSSPQDFIRTAEARSLKAVGAYGMSEFQGLFALQPSTASADHRARGGGIPASPQARIRVRDVERGHLLPPGEAGELEVSAPSMMLHYFGDEQATAAAFTSDGFLRTGDSGMLLADGTFQFIARMGDTLRLGGFLVSPVEISAHLETHPAVQECQVVAAHGRDGYKPVAFVIPAQGVRIHEPELMAHCSQHLAKYKVPVRYVALDEFPVTDGPNGKKVQRTVLRGMAEQALK